MTDKPRFTINRHLVIFLPKQPFVDWLTSSDPNPLPDLTLEDVREDSDAFLIPDDAVEGQEDAEKWVEKRWRMFFEHFLGDWITDERLWPHDLSLKMFHQWFDVHYHSMVWDLSKTPITAEDWEFDEEDEDPTYH